MHFNTRNRDEFLAAAYQDGRDHFDRTAAVHDDRFGSIEATHARCLAAFIAQVNPGEAILDVACGTGKYFESLAALGHAVFGVDYSTKMLEQACRKAPHVTTCHCALQDLRHAHALHGRFGGLICLDALEWVMSDDWPIILAGFAAVLRPGSPAYINVELPDRSATVLPGAPPGNGAKPSEILTNGAYNHFPARDDVMTWLDDAGFAIRDECTGDGYRHLLIRAPAHCDAARS